MQSIACRIGKHNRIVVAVSEEIIPLQAAVGTEDDIGRQEPADVGVVVSAVEVVPAGLYVVVIAPVSERVDVGDVGCVGGHIVTRAIGDSDILPPSVIGVDRRDSAIRIQYPYHVALHILLIPVLHAVALHSYDRPICVVHIVDRMRVCSRPLLRQYLCSVGRVRHSVRRSVCDMLDVLLRGADAVCVSLDLSSLSTY